MKYLSTARTVLSSIILLLPLLMITSCKDDEAPSGAAAALGKSFNLMLDGVTTSIARNIYVSADGTRVLATHGPGNSPNYFYSTDGAGTFTQLNQNNNLNGVITIDNHGNFLLSNKRLYKNNGTIVSVNSSDQLILGDNGKIFSYHVNTGTLRYKNVNDTDFIVVPMPITPTPGSGGSTYYALKAPGIGVMFLDVKGSDTRTVNAYFLDESTLTWTDYSATFERNSVNDCVNPNRYERYSYAGTNVIIMHGCSGIATIDLTTHITTYLEYPEIENALYTDLRDGTIHRDGNGTIYLSSSTYLTIGVFTMYSFSNGSWKIMDDMMSGNEVPFAVDLTGHIYYNSISGAGGSVKGAVQLNVNSNTKSALNLPKDAAEIQDAVLVDNNKLLVVAGSELYSYDAGSDKLTNFGLGNITHTNLLSDGQWLAGGKDKLHLSSNQGQTWTTIDKIFSILDPNNAQMAVHLSRMVNGKLMISGLYTYYYNNQTLGITQTKYNNMMIEVNGSSTSQLGFQFVTDFYPTALSPDGTLYGFSDFVSDIINFREVLEIKANQPTTTLKSKGPSPMIITDSNLQMTIQNAQSGGFEVGTRNSPSEEWQSSNTPLPTTTSSAYGLRIVLSGDKITFINNTEVYVSGN